jgi:hypothetical protein
MGHFILLKNVFLHARSLPLSPERSEGTEGLIVVVQSLAYFFRHANENFQDKN